MQNALAKRNALLAVVASDFARFTTIWLFYASRNRALPLHRRSSLHHRSASTTSTTALQSLGFHATARALRKAGAHPEQRLELVRGQRLNVQPRERTMVGARALLEAVVWAHDQDVG